MERPLLQILVLLLVFSTGGCFVEPKKEETSQVHLEISLDLPAFIGDSRPTFKNHLEHVDITEKLLVVMVEVDAGDIAEPVSDRFVGDPQQEDNVELQLEVNSGDEREIFLVVFYWDGQEVHTYKAFESGVTLEPGDQTLSLEPTEADTWVLEGVLEGIPQDLVPVGVVVEDVNADVVFPEASVEDGPLGWEFSVPNMPVGRFFYLKVHWDDGTWSDPLYFCPLFFGQSTHMQRTINLEAETC